jgi:hypothetical protein
MAVAVRERKGRMRVMMNKKLRDEKSCSEHNKCLVLLNTLIAVQKKDLKARNFTRKT